MRKFLFTFIFSIIMLSMSAQNIEELNIVPSQERRLTARANTDELLLKVMVQYIGDTDNVSLQSLSINLNGTTDLDDVDNIKIYSTGLTDCQNNKFVEHADLLGSCEPQSGDFVCDVEGQLQLGINYLWLAVDINAEATEGNSVDMELLSMTVENETFKVRNGDPIGSREIILARTTLLRPGDYNSTNYRIPAVITARNGSVVAITDKRKYNNGDLPEDIDIVCNISNDGGHTWTEPYTIAYGTGYKHGFGDCALALTNDDNGIIAAFVGGPGFWGSTPTDPLRMYISRSNDNGMTWSEPEDITHLIYGVDCQDEERKEWLGGFFGSGNGLLTSTGRIMFVIAMRENSDGREIICNHAVYSDDNGQTWQVSGRASVGGDEAKVTELVDGRILMSIRHNGNRWYNISEDAGVTWQTTTSEWTDLVAPACNGDLIRYTSVNSGDDKNRLLHSLPVGNSRKNVTVYVSYDEGMTWPMSRCIVPYNSAYSSLCILPDNTIGLYVEESYTNEGDYCTVFYNFSLNWLTKGEDDYVDTDEIYDMAKMKSLEIFPNPTSDYLNIKNQDVKIINIYNMKGQQIMSVQNPDENIVIGVQDFPQGLYLINAIDDKMNMQSAKFIKK